MLLVDISWLCLRGLSLGSLSCSVGLCVCSFTSNHVVLIAVALQSVLKSVASVLQLCSSPSLFLWLLWSFASISTLESVGPYPQASRLGSEGDCVDSLTPSRKACASRGVEALVPWAFPSSAFFWGQWGPLGCLSLAGVGIRCENYPWMPGSVCLLSPPK